MMGRPVWFTYCVCAVFLVAGSTSAFAQPTDLGTLAGASGWSYAYGISDTGYIVGKSQTSSGAMHACMWYNGVKYDLGTLTDHNSSCAYGVNDEGDYVGESMNESDEDYPIVNMTLITNGISDGYRSCAWDVNNNGIVVGEIAYPGSAVNYEAFKYSSGGGLVKLGNPIGTQIGANTATGINDYNEICGTGQAPLSGGGWAFRAYRMSSAGVATAIPLLGGTGNAYGMGINNSGTVCGYSTNSSGYYEAFKWTSGTTATALGTFSATNSSYAFGINDSGTVVGDYDGTSEGGRRAAMWTSSGGIDLYQTYLSTGWKLFRATAINNDGDIVGYGYPPGKTVIHAFLIPH